MACSEPDELVLLGLTAAQCMQEVTVDTETKEFSYANRKKTYMACTNNNCTPRVLFIVILISQGKIVMSTAACMKVTMEIKYCSPTLSVCV